VTNGDSITLTSSRKNVRTSPTTAVAAGMRARFLSRLVATMTVAMAVRMRDQKRRLPDWPPHSAPSL
jgi:hypothetical protein